MPVIKTTQVVHTYKTVTMDKKGPSFGELIDLQIQEALEQGQAMQEFAVLFDDDDWMKLQRESGVTGSKPVIRNV